MSKTQLLSESDNLYGVTGFATVCRNLLPSFLNYFDVVRQIGWEHAGESLRVRGVFVHSGTLWNKGRHLGIMLRRYKPMAHWTLGDIHFVKHVPQVMEVLKHDKLNVPWIGYFPIDSHDWNPDWDKIIKGMDYPVTYSKFGQEILRKQNHDVDMIYHGVDTSIYFPEKIERVKQFRKIQKIDKKFCVLWVGRPNPRKNIVQSLAAFEQFAKDKNDVVMYMHTDIFDPIRGRLDIQEQVMTRPGLWNKIIITDWNSFSYVEGLPVEQMRLFYSMADCFFTTHGGEGFGLPMLEAMACGTPVVGTDYTSTRELLTDGKGKQRGELIKIGDFRQKGKLLRPDIDISDAVECLERVYSDPKLRAIYAKRSYEFGKKMSWEATLPQWEKIFNEIE